MRGVTFSLMLVLMCACGDSPTAPTFQPPTVSPNPAPPARSFATRWLRGVVRDESNLPVAGATLLAYGHDGSRPVVMTDGNGFYEIATSVDRNYTVPWQEVDVSKPGYEVTHNGALLRGEDNTSNFYLFTNARLIAGADARFLLSFDGPLCGIELEYACRHVEVVAPSAGTMTIEFVADDAQTAFSFGPVTYPPSQPKTRISQVVNIGASLRIEVLLVNATPWSGGRNFTLRTAVDP